MSTFNEDLQQILLLLTSLSTDMDANATKRLSDGALWTTLRISSLSAKETMRCFNDMKSVLQALLDGLQETMASFVPNVCPRSVDGILSLPNEILCMIVRSAGSRWDRGPLARTCKKLRQIVLSCPDLWTEITSRDSDSSTETNLSRSQDLPLNIYMEIRHRGLHNKPAVWHNFINLILRHARRWKTFYIHIYDYNDPSAVSVLEQLRGHGLTLSLPLLDSLGVSHENQVDDDEAFLADGNFHFYNSWAMPNLTEISFTNLIPHAVFPPSIATIGMDYTIGYKLNTMLLLNFLRSNPQVRNLSIELLDCELEHTEPSEIVFLEKVESFSIRINLKPMDLIACLMRNIGLPNVATFKVDLDTIYDPEQVDLAVNCALSGQERFDKVTSFELIINRLELEEYNTGRFLSRFPNLNDLSIDASYVALPEQNFWDHELITRRVKIPDLRCVDLKLDGRFYHNCIITGLLDATKVEKLNLDLSSSFFPKTIENIIGQTKFTLKERKDNPIYG